MTQDEGQATGVGADAARALRIVLVSDAAESRVQPLLVAAGGALAAVVPAASDWPATVAATHPDAIVLEFEEVDRAVTERCARAMGCHARPIALFVRRAGAAAYRDCVAAGIGAIVVDGFEERHVAPALALAAARCEEWRQTREELAELRAKLADRRDIERAKGVLARRSRLSEEEAHALLRRSAMAQRITLGAAARAVLGAARVLSAPGEAP